MPSSRAVSQHYRLVGLYQNVAKQMYRLSQWGVFINFITFAILLASLSAGIATDHRHQEDDDSGRTLFRVLFLLDRTVLGVFVCECIIKIVAEGLEPQLYFEVCPSTHLPRICLSAHVYKYVCVRPSPDFKPAHVTETRRILGTSSTSSSSSSGASICWT